MATAIETGRITAADDLRQLLSQAEDRVVNLSDHAGAAELYRWLDQIVELWPSIAAAGVDARAEEARWQSLQARLTARAPRVLQAWQSGAGLEAARLAAAPPASNWWWWIDQRVAEMRRRRLLRAGGLALAVVGIVAGVLFFLDRVVPVDPVARESYRWQTQAEAALAAGDLAAGYQALSQAVAVDPANGPLLIWYGALADLQGDRPQAEQSWRQARALLGDEALFLTERGLSYLRLQQAGQAIDDLQAAIALEPNSARAHLYLGGALEAEGRGQEALSAYEQAAALADAAGNPELVVVARTQMARLISQSPVAPTPTP